MNRPTMNRSTTANRRTGRSGGLPRVSGVAALVVTGLLLAACGPAGSGSLDTLPTDRPAPSPTAQSPQSPAASPAAPPAAPPETPVPPPPPPPPGTTGTGTATPARTITITVWFTRDGKLFPTTRTRPVTPATSRLALTELAAGPTSVEASAGLRNEVASDLVYDVSISGGVATVDLPASFYAGGRDPARLRQAQVVYTLTQFPTVSKVGFQQDGEPTGWPAGTAEYADLLPAIVVTSPAIGQRVTSPVTVAGTANVFEATVSIRILDAAGAPVATTFTTATCGTGCRGDYSIRVTYRVPREQHGTVQVYEVSAKDGSRINVVDIPVILAASQ